MLDKGKIAEFDAPQRLLQNAESHFYSLVKRAGLLTKSASTNRLKLRTTPSAVIDATDTEDANELQGDEKKETSAFVEVQL